MSVHQCRACTAAVAASDHFCEACGQDLRPGPQWLSSTTPGAVCAACANASIDPDGYCERCGRRRVPGRARVELDLGCVVAVTDRGPCRPRNEDAAGIGRSGRAIVGIVCDGVASTVRADDAAHAAVDAGIVALVRDLESGASPEGAALAAFREAQAAVSAVADRRGAGHGAPPSCTYVCAVVTMGAPGQPSDQYLSGADGSRSPATVTVCWVGDSRAYWVPSASGPGPTCLTIDDSLIGQMAAAGIECGPEIGARGTALIRWVGADAADVEPHLRSVRLGGPGRLVLCSDGLSRYLTGPADLAVAETGSPGAAARDLTRIALDAGGQDNITVVVVDVAPDPDPVGFSNQSAATPGFPPDALGGSRS